MNKRNLKISVRSLVESVLRKGDIDNRFIGFSRAQEGTNAHKKLQKDNMEIFKSYEKEVSLKRTFNFDEFDITLEGRADGIIFEDNSYIIEEIKSTNKELINIFEEYNELHWAQAKCYGYIYMLDKKIEDIYIQLSYFQLETNEVKSFRKYYKKEELEEYTVNLIKKYYDFCKISIRFKEIRDISIEKLEFPFNKYRKGQRELAVNTYNTIKKKGILFAKAPTGIGKTISTIFPSVKAIGGGFCDKLFYLTAKTITRTVAENTFNLLREKGLKFRTITLTAKDKICFEKEAACNPEECKYAKGYYDRLNQGIFDILEKEQLISRTIIEEYATKHNLCPFQFSLDLTYWCDGIICDYNYVFDPKVCLRGIIEDSKEEYIFLIDEGHNLVQRGREMFSAEILKSDVLKMRRFLKGKSPMLYKSLGKINSYFIQIRNEYEEDSKKNKFIIDEPKDLYVLIRGFIRNSEEFLIKNKKLEFYDEFLELYFKLNSFLSIGEYYDEGFLTYIDLENKDVKIKIFCIHPREKLKSSLKKSISQIIFSATLTPLGYFFDLLGGDKKSYRMKLESPFDFNKLFLSIIPLSTRYKDRDKTINELCSYLKSFVNMKKGNYMIFFPSYEYMEKVYDVMKDCKVKILVQEKDMSEEDRETFLNNFKENNMETLLGFVVIGGVFSEGIDLVGDKLIGAAIIGVGLPKVCYERELIKDYYDRLNSLGYKYSYVYPGMNKVLQAAGRVIRSEEDKGALLFIDDRFSTLDYYKLMPGEWSNIKVYKDKHEFQKNLKSFWNNNL